MGRALAINPDGSLGWEKPKHHARGVHKPGVMNGTESTYEQHLAALKTVGAIQWYAFEAIKFRLAKDTFYTPDFMVMLSNGEIEIHEVKGYWEEDARVKIKCAAEAFPFRFIGVTKRAKKDGGGFDYEVFG